MPAPPSLGRRLAPLGAGVMALAIGIAVGAGPLSDVGTGTDQLASPSSYGEGAEPTLTDSSAVRSLEAADALVAAAAPTLYDDGLAERSVALVQMPGADPAVVDALRAQAAAAGARVTASYRIGEEMLSSGAATLVDSLGRRLVEQLPDLPVDADTPAYERAGMLVGMVVASQRPEGQDPVPATVTVGESLRTAGLLDGPADPRPRAPLVLVVLPADDAPGSAAEGLDAEVVASDAVTSGLVRGLAGRSVGTVVAGSTASGADGALDRLRESAADADDAEDDQPAYATVDGVDRPTGQVLAGLALLQVDDGVRGDWGAWGDDGVVPAPAP